MGWHRGGGGGECGEQWDGLWNVSCSLALSQAGLFGQFARRLLLLIVSTVSSDEEEVRTNSKPACACQIAAGH